MTVEEKSVITETVTALPQYLINDAAVAVPVKKVLSINFKMAELKSETFTSAAGNGLTSSIKRMLRTSSGCSFTSTI